MPTRKYKPEQIVTLLRQLEVEVANGKTTPRRDVRESLAGSWPACFSTLERICGDPSNTDDPGSGIWKYVTEEERKWLHVFRFHLVDL
jgi:hypothetical protein